VINKPDRCDVVSHTFVNPETHGVVFEKATSEVTFCSQPFIFREYDDWDTINSELSRLSSRFPAQFHFAHARVDESALVPSDDSADPRLTVHSEITFRFGTV
jgi:hypothetical protein